MAAAEGVIPPEGLGSSGIEEAKSVAARWGWGRGGGEVGRGGGIGEGRKGG